MTNQWFEDISKEELVNHFIDIYPMFRKARKDRKGLIYIVKCGEYYKIGKSSAKNFSKRMSAYRTHNPFPIEIIKHTKVEDCDGLEELIHMTFSCFNHQGEWYKLTDNALEALLSILKYYGK